MRANIFTVAALVAMMALTSCNNEEEKAIEVSRYITVNAGVGTLTRATSTSFEKDDKISIYAWTNDNSAVQTDLVVNNSINTYDGVSSWSAAPMMLWKDMETAHYFIGVYPTKEIVDFTNDSYATVGDVLVATILGDGRKAADGVVPMTFDHIMARLDVNLTFRTQWEETPLVTSVSVEAKPEATVNYLTKPATAPGVATDVVLTQQTANTAYSGIAVPQGASKINIVIADKTYTYTHPTTFMLIAGKIQTVNLIVGRDQITLGSITINPWDDTIPPINGGEAQID